MPKPSPNTPAARPPVDATIQRRLSVALSTFNMLPDDGRVRTSTVAALLGISLSTLWRRIQDERLPAPRRDGGLCTFRAGDIRAVLARATPGGQSTEAMRQLGERSVAKRAATAVQGGNYAGHAPTAAVAREHGPAVVPALVSRPARSRR
jgi:predicted DNA-binding transcriptional regulator AlpA